jgi:hypothetical protein
MKSRKSPRNVATQKWFVISSSYFSYPEIGRYGQYGESVTWPWYILVSISWRSSRCGTFWVHECQAWKKLLLLLNWFIDPFKPIGLQSLFFEIHFIFIILCLSFISFCSFGIRPSSLVGSFFFAYFLCSVSHLGPFLLFVRSFARF